MFYGCAGMHNWQTIAKGLALSQLVKRFQLPRRTPHDHATVTRASRRNQRLSSLTNMLLCPRPSHHPLQALFDICCLLTAFEVRSADQRASPGPLWISASVWRRGETFERQRERREKLTVGSRRFFFVFEAPSGSRRLQGLCLASRSRCVPLCATRLLVNLLQTFFFFFRVVSTEKNILKKKNRRWIWTRLEQRGKISMLISFASASSSYLL